MVRASADTALHPGARKGSLEREVVIVHPPTARAAAAALVERIADDATVTRSVVINRSLPASIGRLDPDAVVVLHTPGELDLVRICRRIRPCIACRMVVVATATEGDDGFVIDALDAGADDFVLADVSDQVLIARIRAAMRMRPARTSPPAEITVGDVVINTEAHVVLIGGGVVNCPRLQYGLLLILARHAGETVSRDHLVAEMWGDASATFNPRRLRVAISTLRVILGSGPDRPVLERVAHVGYRLAIPS